jgi:uncharacterized protein YdeI (YjbR/CyaY-like superfamily)
VDRAKTFYARDAETWRAWLHLNHLLEHEVWLIFYKANAGEPGVSYDDALDWALCYGWIDSMIRKIDDLRYARKFTPRRSGSVWSKSNIDRVERLKDEGRMTERGLALFQDRSGETSLAEKFRANEPPFPDDLLDAIKKNRRAWENFQEFTPGYKRRYAMWISGARTAETRDHRIAEAVGLIAKNVKSLMK